MKTMISNIFKKEIISIKTKPLYVHTQPGSRYPLLIVTIDMDVKNDHKNLVYSTEKQARSIMMYEIMNREIDEILKSREEITKDFDSRIKKISEYNGIEVINYNIDFKIQV